MSKFSVKQLSIVENSQAWGILLKKSDGSTVFHHPLFLSYHQDRFSECHVGFFKGENLIGVMPLAVAERDGKYIALSPYGASYGGAVFVRNLSYSESASLADSLYAYLADLKVDSFRFTPPLGVYYRDYCETFLFALMEKGARVISSDISSVVPLQGNLVDDCFTSRCRNTMRKAESAGASIEENASMDRYWSLMEKTFERHGKSPTHSKEQFELLNTRFPEQIYADICLIDGVPAAGIGYMEVNSRVNMSFYLCSDPDFNHTQAMSYLVGKSILKSQAQGYEYFDFGTSSSQMKGSQGVFRFKESYGAIGRFRHLYEMPVCSD